MPTVHSKPLFHEKTLTRALRGYAFPPDFPALAADAPDAGARFQKGECV